MSSSEARLFRCKTVLQKNASLDYELIEVEPKDAGGDDAYAESRAHPQYSADDESHQPALTLWAGPLRVGMPLLAPSYPSGRVMEIDRSDECVLSSIEPFTTESGRHTIKHMCDTEGGSSGGPLLDRKTGYVVALHWGGRDQQFNMAIPMALIVQDLEAGLDAETLARLRIAGGY